MSSSSMDKQNVLLPSDDVEKTTGVSYVIPAAENNSNVKASRATEYEDYLHLKAHYDQNPRAWKRLLLKLDLRILPMLWLFYLLNALDKSNAGNVKIYTFLQDTNMTGKQFNMALTWYFFTYAGLEAPSNMCMLLVVGWGAVTLGTAWVKSYHDFCAARVFLGVFEAGLFQGAFYTLSTWYLPTELQTRCALWYSATVLSGAFGGLLAYAVGPLQGRLGLSQWQYLFVIEGSVTVFFGMLGFRLCPDFPDRWGSCWFGPDEMRYLRMRIRYKDGPVPPDESFRWGAFWEAVRDWKTYFIASLLAFGGSVPTYSVNYTLALMVKNLGYSSIKAQAMTAPPYVFAFFCIIAIALYSDKHQCRARSLLISYTVGTAGIAILWPSLHHENLSGLSYSALFLVVAGYNMQAPAVGSWLGSNVRNPTKRAAAMGWQSTWGQLFGGTVGANIFFDAEAPTYTTGFTILVVLVAVGGYGACVGNWYCLRAANLRKDRVPLEEVRGKYTDDELTRMEEYSPFFRYTL